MGRAELTTASHSPVNHQSPVLVLSPRDMKLFCVIFFLFLGTATAARAPVSPDEVHFTDESSGLPRQGKQNMLNCLMGCTRELRVRRQNNRTSSSGFSNISKMSHCHIVGPWGGTTLSINCPSYFSL